MGKQVRETPKIHEAFEYYYLLGFERTHQKVADHFKISVKQIQKWSATFNWVERCRERDKRNFELIAESDDKLYVEAMTKNRSLIAQSIETFAKNLKDGKVDVKSIYDFERLVRLDMDVNATIENKNKAKIAELSAGSTDSNVLSAIGKIKGEIEVSLLDSSDKTSDNFSKVDDIMDFDEEPND